MPGHFLTELEVRRLSDRRWELLADLVYESAVLGRRLIVPKGFQTDFASIPEWLPRWLDVGQPAAVVHDYLYQTHEAERDMADAMYEEANAADAEPWWKRRLLYWAVRLFGESAYDSGPDRLLMFGNAMLVQGP
jgi:hypothetical protein